MAKTKKTKVAKTKNPKKVLTPDEKLYKAVQALFVLQARLLDMGNEDIRKILGVEKAEVNQIAKIINKTLKKASKKAEKK